MPALRTLRKLFQDASLSLRVPVHYALIGGLAVSAWGVVRATQDIDVLADSHPSPLRNLAIQRRLQKFLEQRGCMAEWRIGEPDDPIPLLLRLELPSPLGLGADILWVHKRWQREALSRRRGTAWGQAWISKQFAPTSSLRLVPPHSVALSERTGLVTS